MRLIDADKLLDILDVMIVGHKSASDVYDVVDSMTIVDAVPVVRCKDCRYYLNSNEKCGLIDTRLHFYETDKTWTEDCFCSWGERREDGAERK